MMADILKKNLNVKYGGEGAQPYFYPKDSAERLRLRSIDVSKDLLRKEYTKYILLKALYESQNVRSLLDEFKGAKGIWIFRNYNAVIDSHLHHYKTFEGLDYIKIFCSGRNWMNEGVCAERIEDLCKRIKRLKSNYDAFGLYWYLRNSLYREMATDDRIILVKYEDLVERPEANLPAVFKFLELDTAVPLTFTAVPFD